MFTTCLFQYITNGSEHMFTSALIFLYLAGAQVKANLVYIPVKLVHI